MYLDNHYQSTHITLWCNALQLLDEFIAKPTPHNADVYNKHMRGSDEHLLEFKDTLFLPLPMALLDSKILRKQITAAKNHVTHKQCYHASNEFVMHVSAELARGGGNVPGFLNLRSPF